MSPSQACSGRNAVGKANLLDTVARLPGSGDLGTKPVAEALKWAECRSLSLSGGSGPRGVGLRDEIAKTPV